MPIYRSDNVFNQMDLSSLRHFFAIATFGGFSKASRATGVSQPALSLGLQKLEKALGVQLIDRNRGRFRLTGSGQDVYSFCKQLEINLESLVGGLGGKDISVPRRLRIGTGFSIGYGPLAKVCLEAASSERQLEIEITAGNTYHLLEAVKEGSLDASLVPDDIFDKRLKVTPLFRDRLIFVHSRTNAQPFTARKWSSGSLDSALITYPRETPMRALVDRLCGKHELRFKTVISVNGLDGITGLVRRGLGGAFVLRSLVDAELRTKELVEAKIPFELPPTGVALVSAPDEHGDEVVRTLKQLIPVA